MDFEFFNVGAEYVAPAETQIPIQEEAPAEEQIEEINQKSIYEENIKPKLDTDVKIDDEETLAEILSVEKTIESEKDETESNNLSRYENLVSQDRLLRQLENPELYESQKLFKEAVAREYGIDINDIDGIKGAISDIIESNPDMFSDEELMVLTLGDFELLEEAYENSTSKITDETIDKYTNITGKDPEKVNIEELSTFKQLTQVFNDDVVEKYFNDRNNLDSETLNKIEETINEPSFWVRAEKVFK